MFPNTGQKHIILESLPSRYLFTGTDKNFHMFYKIYSGDIRLEYKML